MELENQTPFPAMLFRGCIDEERIAASLVVRRTFDLVAGYLVRSAEEIWPVSPGPWISPAGPMAGDELFYRGGVDLFVFGSARSAKAVPRLDVTLEAGQNFKYTLAVFGDRVWTKSPDGSIVPGSPRPFTDMPLTMANAYGGTDEWDELPIPFPGNPIGKGYSLTAEEAIGKPLPNIENPKALIRKFGDHPEPVGVAAPPFPYPLRGPKTIEFAPNGVIAKIDPKFFNAAFPDMIADRLQVGDRIRIAGISPERPVQFDIPAADVRVRLEFADAPFEIAPAVDQIVVELDQSRVCITYRHAFRYRIRPMEKRSCALLNAF